MPRAKPSSPTAPASRPRLTRERVVATAIELADAARHDVPTMRALAAALEVQPMSIYHHIAGKEELVDAMVDSVFAEIALPGKGGWQDELRRRYRSARAVLRSHPWALPLMESRANPGADTLRQHDAVLGVLLDAGFSMPRTALAYAMLDAYLYGFVLQEVALPFDQPEDVPGMAQEMLAAFPVDTYPHLAAFMAGHVMQPGYDYGAEFDNGLDLLLDALSPVTA